MPSRATFLSPPDMYRPDWACRPIHQAFGRPPYLVGSALTRPDYRDIDLRSILDDDRFDAMFAESPDLLLLVNVAFSDLVSRAAGQRAPIDFQVQRLSEANQIEGVRVPMGMRDASGWLTSIEHTFDDEAITGSPPPSDPGVLPSPSRVEP